MKKPSMGLRLRVALAFTIVFSLIMCALGFTLFTAFEDMEDTLVERLMNDEVNFMVARLRDNPQLAAPANPHLRAYVVRTPADESTLPAVLHNLGTGQHEVFDRGREMHVAVRDITGGRLYVAYDVGLFQQRERQFLILLGLSIFAVMAVSLTAGYWLSGVLVRQITQLAETVDTLAPGTLRQPLAQPGQEAEVAQLARAFDNYQAKLDTLLRREQEFTADASHELRTPLTAIRTSCELLAEDASLIGKARDRVLAIDEAARRMSAQLDALLHLAREQSAAADPVAIAECAEDAAAPCRGEAMRRGVRIEIAIAREAVFNVNRQALHLALSNLLRNAVRHTHDGTVRVTLHDNQLSVTDTGSGIAPEDLPRVFERYYRGHNDGGGSGLGLAIVKRICDQAGWSITVDSTPGSGTTFVITLRNHKII